MAIALAFVLWIFVPTTSLPLKVVAPIGVLGLIVVATLINAVLEVMYSNRLPKVVLGRRPTKEFADSQVLCLLAGSELFSHDTLVSFYYQGEDNFELLIGLGKVVIIQEDKRIQVLMMMRMEEHKEIVEKVAANDSSVLKRLRVKPGVPEVYIKSMELPGTEV